MSETKLELTERLRRENRWDEAANFKETERADFRSKGMNRKEAVEAAWAAMEEAYPPLPQSETEPATASVRVQGLSDIPDDWPKMSDNATLQAELSWCQAQGGCVKAGAGRVKWSPRAGARVTIEQWGPRVARILTTTPHANAMVPLDSPVRRAKQFQMPKTNSEK